MNKERRARIMKAMNMINDARVILEQTRDEESDYFENMPDSLKESERGVAAEEAADKLSEVVDDLENIDLSEFEE